MCTLHANAQEPTPTTPSSSASAAAPSITTLPPAASATSAAQGVAVLGTNGARDDAFGCARSIYASTLRPKALDELRARVLGGDAAPTTASKEIRELAELRAGITGEDAASRRVLAGIAQQLKVQAVLVVSRARVAAVVDAGSEEDAGTPTPPATPSARLFLADSGDFDAARYEPDETGSWKGTATSLIPRFPPPPPTAERGKGSPPKLVADGTDKTEKNRPFYLSPWLWAAVGAAALIGTFFFFASQDNSDDPIHLQMNVPR